MIYTWAYSNEQFSTLSDVKSELRNIATDLLEQRGLDMVRDRNGRALYDVDIQIKLTPK